MDLMRDLSLNARKLIVGIDFGTTFSGVAWAEIRRPDQQFVIDTWPTGLGLHEGHSAPKIATELRYVRGGVEWGAMIPPFVDREEWFKLHLEDARNEISLLPIAATNNSVSSFTLGGNNGPEKLTRDYLKELYDHLMYMLEQKLGAGILSNTSIDFVLTVPAIWSEKAKERTLKACRSAGIKPDSKVTLVSEPEAAAIYTLHGLDPHNLKIGDTFVVCDAGGGTVDLISYTITQLYPILKVVEAAPGGGYCCGSTFLNRSFKKYLESQLGQEAGWDEELLAEAMQKFETVIKKQFSSANTGESYTIMVPGLANNERLGIRRGRLTIKPNELARIFDPVIDKIISLVKDQIRTTQKSIRAVLLVGGFGQNTYLKQRLRSSLDRSIDVMQPPNAWTAVVRGAVMMGLAQSDSSLTRVGVGSRAARKHYGVELHVTFESSKHDASKKFWDPRTGKYRVYTMHWFIKKGNPVEESKPHPINFFTDFPASAGQPTSTSLTVYQDELSPTAPVHRNANSRELVHLEANLRQLPRSSYASTATQGADGNRYYVISGFIEATYYSASTKYMLQVAGNRYDTVTAEHV